MDQQCSGTLRAAISQLNENIAGFARLYEGSNCIGDKYIDSNTDLAKNFGEAIGTLNPLLTYQVCFNQQTFLSNDLNIEETDSAKKLILEEHNKLTSTLRIEDDSKKGFDVPQGECRNIENWAQGRLDLKPDWFNEKMDRQLFDKLQSEHFFIPSLDDPAIYENKEFIEETVVTVKPGKLWMYIVLAIFTGWIAAILHVYKPLLDEYKRLNRAEANSRS